MACSVCQLNIIISGHHVLVVRVCLQSLQFGRMYHLRASRNKFFRALHTISLITYYISCFFLSNAVSALVRDDLSYKSHIVNFFRFIQSQSLVLNPNPVSSLYNVIVCSDNFCTCTKKQREIFCISLFITTAFLTLLKDSKYYAYRIYLIMTHQPY